MGYSSNSSSDARSEQEVFVRFSKFLDNATALGVTRIASCYGLNQSGTLNLGTSPPIALNGQGLGYWDEANNAGINAFVVYQFANATVPFYVLLQWSLFDTSSPPHNFGTAPGAPGSHPDTSWAGVGIQIALRPDGTNPWGGTTRNNGFDVKSNPVWTTGSTGTLFVWPRCNSPGGALYNGSRAACSAITNASLADGGTPIRHRLTLIIDENNIFSSSDFRAQQNHDIFFFGKYTPLSGTVAPVPYFSFSDGNDPPFATNTVFGSMTPASGSGIRDGGVALPSMGPSGTVSGFAYDVADPANFFNRFFMGYMDAANTGSNTPSLTGTFNGSLNPGAGVMLERPMLIYSDEAAASGPVPFNGLIGYSTDFLRFAHPSSQTLTTLSGATRLIVGNMLNAGGVAGKFTVPFTSSLGPMGIAWNRNGIEI
jgi:hypothetical protein